VVIHHVGIPSTGPGRVGNCDLDAIAGECAALGLHPSSQSWRHPGRRRDGMMGKPAGRPLASRTHSQELMARLGHSSVRAAMIYQHAVNVG
jgi:hypothetical protein